MHVNKAEHEQPSENASQPELLAATEPVCQLVSSGDITGKVQVLWHFADIVVL